MQTKVSQPSHRPAFALPTVLIISTGVLILLLTLVTVVDLERTSSKVRLGSYQADLAVESGLEEAKMILAGVTSSDTYAVATVPFAAEFDDNGDGSISSVEDGELDLESNERGRPYLYAIQGEAGDDLQFRLTPLFATNEGPDLQRVTIDGELSLPDDPGLSQEQEGELGNRILVGGPAHIQAPVTAWRTIRDQDGVPLSRYSYWIEDMQGYLDAEYVPGNSRSGRHARANEDWEQNIRNWNRELQGVALSYGRDGGEVPLWPAPGINPGYVEEADGFLNPQNRLLSEVAVYTLDQEQEGVVDNTSLDDIVRGVAPQAPTPASILALSGVQAPLERVPTGLDRGRLELKSNSSSPQPRWIEENFVTGNRTWEEQALIPFAPGLSEDVMGAPRMNLNRLLQSASGPGFGGVFVAGEFAVQEMASFINRALPDFAETRRGGFGNWGRGDNEYLETLAACALDYADIDSTPIVRDGRFRGIDSHPFVSEYLITTLNSEFDRSDGQNLFLITEVEVFAELWNMSNHPVTGNFELGYENTYVFEALQNPEVDFMSPLARTMPSGDESWSEHRLIRQSDGNWYTPPRQITIPSNGYTMVSTGVITYHFFIGEASDFLPFPLEYEFLERPMNYRLRWNGVLCDRSAAGIELIEEQIDFREQKTHAVIPGTWGEFSNFYSGMYDLRQSWWAGLSNSDGVVSENSYPNNYSPGRRNVRWGSIASVNPGTLHGRLLVSSWPDGGHDSSFAFDQDFHQIRSGSEGLRPDDEVLYLRDIPAESSRAPTFLSNLGRFVSETELGNVFDPIMWKSQSSPSRTEEIWYHSQLNENDVPEVNRLEESEVVGGGNTLRIGRLEHSDFRGLGDRASHLLDLFHCGVPLSSDVNRRNGQIRKVEGHVNLNTASRDVLRALVAGPLVTDPELGRELTSYDTRSTYALRHIPLDEPEDVSATDATRGGGNFADEGGTIADAIIAARPFVSRSQLASLRYPEEFDTNPNLAGELVFGNKSNHALGERLQISDRASEEVFARIYNSTTIRSRNFRIHVIGQSLEQTPSGRVRVKATRKKSFRVFADAGTRNSLSGAIDPQAISIETLYETNL